MSNPDCFWFPQLAECQDPPEACTFPGDPTCDQGPTGGPGGPDGKPGQKAAVSASIDELVNPLYGQIAYLSVALVNAAAYGVVQFFYHKTYTNSHYATWTDISALGTNFWQYADMLLNYGMLVVWSVATITQILATAGIAVDINMLVWELGVIKFGALVLITYSLIQIFAMYTVYSENSTTTTDAATTSALFDKIYNEWMTNIGGAAFSGILLAWNHANWEAANKKALGAEPEVAKEQALHAFFDI